MSSSDELRKLQQQHEEMGRQMERLKAQVEAEAKAKAKEKARRIGLDWKPAHCEKYQILTQQVDGAFGILTRWNNTNVTTVSVFETEKQAQEFADAFTVLLELRACEGVYAPDSEELSACIIPGRDGKITINVSVCKHNYPSTLFCRFKTVRDANLAAEKVGADRLIAAAKTLGFYQ
jgi:hypothetical protein